MFFSPTKKDSMEQISRIIAKIQREGPGDIKHQRFQFHHQSRLRFIDLKPSQRLQIRNDTLFLMAFGKSKKRADAGVDYLFPFGLTVGMNPDGTGRSIMPELMTFGPSKHRGNSLAEGNFVANIGPINSVKNFRGQVFSDKILNQFIVEQDVHIGE